MSDNPEGRIEVRDLVVRYGEVAAVDGVSFSVARGEHVTLLGPSGCGKTTTLRAIAGLETPSAGSIHIAGQTVYSAAERRNVPAEKRGISMVFQSYAVWPHMSVFDNVAYGLRVRKLPRAEVAAQVERGKKVRTVSLAGVEDAGVSQPLPVPVQHGLQVCRARLRRSDVEKDCPSSREVDAHWAIPLGKSHG